MHEALALHRVKPHHSLMTNDVTGTLGSLTKQIVNDLGAAIVTGEFSHGTPFPVEADLGQRYRASRSVVREAVKVLNAKGLVTARPRRGTSVLPPSEWNLFDPDILQWILRRKFSLPLLIEFTHLRLAIEPEAAALAADSATEAQLAAIEAALDRMSRAYEGEESPLESDIAFHLAILDASNNRFFIRLKSTVDAALQFSIRYTNRASGLRFAEIGDHARISNAIMAHRRDEARDAAKLLLEKALALMVAGLEQHGERTKRTL